VSGILSLVRAVVENETAGTRSALFGVVSAVFPHESADDDNNLEVNVRLKHEDVELRKVPVMVSNIGVAAVPAVGDLVLVQFIGGDLNQPIVAGRFYHADARPPLHKEDEIIFEHRVTSDGTINQLRFANDGSIFLQRDVTKPADNSAAKAGIAIDGASGDITIKTGDKLVITLHDAGDIEIKADGKKIDFTCDTMTVNGKLTVKGDTEVDGVFKAVHGTSTTIDGNKIQGG
jgi:phage gp45-like